MFDRQGTVPNSLGSAPLVGLVFALALIASACAQPIAVSDAELSIDETRVALLLDSCNVPVEVAVVETEDQVAVSIARTDGKILVLGGGDCQDRHILQLASPLGDRVIVQGKDSEPVSPTRPRIPAGAWPYDRGSVSEAEYEAALNSMVECVMEQDPEVTAWVYQDLNWLSYDWDKAPDENGHMSAPAVGACSEEHLTPLRLGA